VQLGKPPQYFLILMIAVGALLPIFVSQQVISLVAPPPNPSACLSTP
jgi:hypothetical protein